MKKNSKIKATFFHVDFRMSVYFTKFPVACLN